MTKIGTLFLGVCLIGSGAPSSRKSPPFPQAGNPRVESRIITHHAGTAERVYVQHGWQTTIELPAEDNYLDFLLGDTPATKREQVHWVVNSFQSAKYVSVRPNKNTQSVTDLTITTEKPGHDITLILVDVTHEADAHADTTVILRADGEPTDPGTKQKYDQMFTQVTAISEKIDEFRKRLDSQDEHIKQGLSDAKDKALLQDAATPRENYKYDHKKGAKQPFGVKQMWNNGKYTFITVNTSEVPALYAYRDGKPNWVEWDFKNGVYFVPIVINEGELRVGKKQLRFHREEGKKS